MKDFVERQVHINYDYGSVSGYVRTLIREDRKRLTEENLEALLIEGLDSGESKAMPKRDWEDIRQAPRKKAALREMA